MTNLITEARELCERATPGPWESGNYGAVCLKSGFRLGNIEGSGNAVFIARSRTLIPELCDALEKATNACKDCPGLTYIATHGGTEPPKEDKHE